MPNVIVTTREGEQKNIPYTPGTSLMQAIVEGGIDELLALCGGVCSCATCHVLIGEDFVNSLEPKSDDEDELLSGSDHKCERSRLSCQVRLEEAHDGLTAEIAPED